MISQQLDKAPSEAHCPGAPGLASANSPLCSLSRAKSLSPLLVLAIQAQYDNWDESDVDTFAEGGICHYLAEAMAGVLSNAEITAATVSCMHEQHVYVVCQLAEGVYKLDVPYSRYERGGGYRWSKIPNVVFDSTDLDWYLLDIQPLAFEDYLDF